MSSNTDSEDPVKKAIGTCEMIQHMIDLAAKQLDGLRTMCAASEITQKEIRDTEVSLCLASLCIAWLTCLDVCSGVMQCLPVVCVSAGARNLNLPDPNTEEDDLGRRVVFVCRHTYDYRCLVLTLGV